jgi:hypothetical protein
LKGSMNAPAIAGVFNIKLSASHKTGAPAFFVL